MPTYRLTSLGLSRRKVTGTAEVYTRYKALVFYSLPHQQPRLTGWCSVFWTSLVMRIQGSAGRHTQAPFRPAGLQPMQFPCLGRHVAPDPRSQPPTMPSQTPL
eukprot:scaffold3449_cov339-Prasinococcus_capsulatus_cf.AAC.9